MKQNFGISVHSKEYGTYSILTKYSVWNGNVFIMQNEMWYLHEEEIIKDYEGAGECMDTRFRQVDFR
jgi:hypothetical protein